MWEKRSDIKKTRDARLNGLMEMNLSSKKFKISAISDSGFTKKFGKKKLLFPLIIFLLACLVRFIFIIFYANNPLMGDGVVYDQVATSILNGHGFALGPNQPTSITMPLYPIFLALIYFIFGHTTFVGLVGNALMGALTCVVVYFIGKKLFNENVGLLASFMAIFHNFLISSNLRLLTETMFTFFVALSVLYSIKILYEEYNPRTIFFFSLFCSLSVLTRPILAFFPFVVMAVLFFKKKAFRPSDLSKFIKVSILISTIFLLPISFWSIRNYAVHKVFMPLSAVSGLTLYLSFHPEQGKIFGTKDHNDTVIYEAEKIKSEVARNRFYQSHALPVFRSLSFADIARLTCLKLIFFWSLIDWGFIGNGVATYNYASGFIFPFAILGIIFCFKRNVKALVLAVPVLYAMIFSVVLFGMPRFRLPVEPYLIIFAAYAIYLLFQRLNKMVFSTILLWWFGLNIFFYLYSYEFKTYLKYLGEKVGLW